MREKKIIYNAWCTLEWYDASCLSFDFSCAECRLNNPLRNVSETFVLIDLRRFTFYLPPGYFTSYSFGCFLENKNSFEVGASNNSVYAENVQPLIMKRKCFEQTFSNLYKASAFRHLSRTEGKETYVTSKTFLNKYLIQQAKLFEMLYNLSNLESYHEKVRASFQQMPLEVKA